MYKTFSVNITKIALQKRFLLILRGLDGTIFIKVEKVMNLDFTFERQLELTRAEERQLGREEGREEGRAEGREEGRTEVILALLKEKTISCAKAAEQLGISEEQIKKMLDSQS